MDSFGKHPCALVSRDPIIDILKLDLDAAWLPYKKQHLNSSHLPCVDSALGIAWGITASTTWLHGRFNITLQGWPKKSLENATATPSSTIIYIYTWSRVACRHPSPLSGIPLCKVRLNKMCKNWGLENKHLPWSHARHTMPPCPWPTHAYPARPLPEPFHGQHRGHRPAAWAPGHLTSGCERPLLQKRFIFPTGGKTANMAKLDKAHKTVILGDFRLSAQYYLTVFGMIRRTRGQQVHESSWRRSFPSEDMKTDMKSKVKINMLQTLAYSLPLHCSSFVQAFWCFNNPWATSIPIDLDWSGRTYQVGLQVLSEGNT